ncbi:MAG: hypothetical protein Q4A32_08545 [Lachnospiraceae bacterium]|nr:hypothetical protein [Lachnospiraceae bacterium]
MQKPKMKIVRFSAEDVIATSAIPGEIVTPGNPLGVGQYLTRMSEYDEYKNGTASASTVWCYLYLNDDGYLSGGSDPVAEDAWSEICYYSPYAWFNKSESTWYTEEKYLDDYNAGVDWNNNAYFGNTPTN